MAFSPTSIADPLLLTPDHAAWHLGVPSATVLRLLRTGEVPAVRIGSRWLIRRADLEGWVARLVPEGARGQIGREGSEAQQLAARREREPHPELAP
jgi:excisionase family DNA binding protein